MAQLTQDKDWWRGAIIYQVYPRSYQDSNGDGIGDLAGITQRLAHISELGADAVWISPFFTSPMKDFGYDVSDYRDVDPIFGDLAAFDQMIAGAHALGLKVMIDLVLSHTSDQHEWFRNSSANSSNEQSDWYVWADAKPDGTAPNNWLSIFGGPAWTWNSARRQYYMHNFLSSQPDLNFHNPDVQDALLDVGRFWLDRGVDGFRLDTINFYFCDKQLRDNPALPDDQRNSDIAPDVNPYNYQNHLYDKSQPENIAFLQRLRGLMDEYPAVTAVGEVGDAQVGMQLLADYTRGDDRIHMCYTFDFLSEAPLSATRVYDTLKQFEANGDSWVCWAFSNHDVIRHATRWNQTAAQSKLHAALLMSLRGSVCLYQGEEVALPEADIPFERLQDPYGIAFWPKFKGRDGCRTPMVWQADTEHNGFSNQDPWLPIPAEHNAYAIDQHAGVNGSVLEFYRSFIAFRNQWTPLVKGTFEDMQAQDGVFSFLRKQDNETLFCAFNLSAQISSCAVPDGRDALVLDQSGYAPPMQDGVVELPAFSAAFLQLT